MREADLIYDWNPLDGGFDYRTARVELNDETLRDGLQSPSVSDPSMPDKVRLLHLMADLGIASADIADNALADVRYATGRHTAPIFAGDTVFAATEIREKRDFPGRPDLGILASTLRGHKFRKEGDTIEKIAIFYLELEQALKRRSHYV